MNKQKTRHHRPLDRFDRAILRILQKNNRIPQREIAEQIHLSTAAVQRRISALEADGIIQGNVALVAPEALRSTISIIVEVHFQNDRSTIIEPAKALFQNTPEVQQCYHVSGNGGFILIMLVEDITHYALLSQRLFADNDAVATYRTLVVLDRIKTGTEIPIPDEP
ncbi:AsnC family transcriptional regulator [Neokomagataea thailandica NBRC 106555]|uniref:Lrp/AsnC family transcriptional regulator n=2 Tax=Neokomagataea TaxID=1223423 RepID=A0A4Y6V7I7_9PROT|nr:MULTISPECIES: Lrp/AsnC family transcriptional regulator [Neokomagataea]QDH24467.1 Lrp/AsnC family transcriptional regulator [Neokomagataea tanensis]GBR55019.1 AsnC family transcriptional regulator [Neokomagataea thailandica NBRC 106555]